MISIIIPGEPVPQARPRAARIGNGVRFYNTPAVENYKKAVQQYARLAMRSRPPLTGALALEIKIFRGIPKSWSAAKKAAALRGEIQPIQKPDLSNYIKLLEDALNGIAWEDDSQIVLYQDCSKNFGATPQVEIHIKEVL